MTTKVGQAAHLRDVGTSEVQGILNHFKECWKKSQRKDFAL